MIKQIKCLQKGDSIGVLTASDPVINTPAMEWINRGRKTLEEMGFKVEYGKSIFASTNWTAGSSKLRAEDFMGFIKKPHIKMILTAMGGENAHQILPLLDFDVIADNPKVIMGYSDPTVLLNPIAHFSKTACFYGYHLASFDPEWSWFNEYDKNAFNKIFIEGVAPFEIPASQPRECWKKGKHQGRLVGGGLTDLIKLLSTPWEPKWDQVILILETMNQNLQQIDVHLTHLLQSGVFNKISGLLLGKFYNCGSAPQLKSLVLEILKEFDFPILKTEDFGHFSHICPLPIGGFCEINSEIKSFKILERIFN